MSAPESATVRIDFDFIAELDGRIPLAGSGIQSFLEP
jgi:hypothetical protein